MRPEAKQRFDAGMTHYAARRWTDAIREFEAAYAIEPRREILFAQAQATRLSGACGAAVPLFERFLATRPPVQQVEATRIALARCAAIEAQTPKPLSSPAAAPALVTAPPVPRWYQDRWGAWLAIGGGVLLVPSAVLLASAFGADRDAREADVYGDYEPRRRTAEGQWRWGMGGALVGTALIAAGAVRYVTVALDRGEAHVAFAARF